MRLIVVFLLLSCTCYGQEFKKLRVGFGYGRTFAWPEYNGDRTTSCAVIFLEPSYRINDRIAVGFRMEYASATMLPTIGGGQSGISSYGLNAQYYFSNKEFRPFVGAGVGSYTPGQSGSSTPFTPRYNDITTSFGFYPRIGFDYHHLTLNVEYNFAPPSGVAITRYKEQSWDSAYTEQGELNNSYGSVKLGLVIGGGLKKK